MCCHEFGLLVARKSACFFALWKTAEKVFRGRFEFLLGGNQIDYSRCRSCEAQAQKGAEIFFHVAKNKSALWGVWYSQQRTSWIWIPDLKIWLRRKVTKIQKPTATAAAAATHSCAGDRCAFFCLLECLHDRIFSQFLFICNCSCGP